MTTKQKHTQLKNLSKSSKLNLFQMLLLANDILADHEYVDGLGGEDVALDMLQNDEFAHFGRNPSLSRMLFLLRTFPDEKIWKEHKYNVTALLLLANGDGEEDKEKVQRTAWKQRALDAELRVEELTRELNEAKKQIAWLTEQLGCVEKEAAELRGELRGLRSLSAA